MPIAFDPTQQNAPPAMPMQGQMPEQQTPPAQEQTLPTASKIGEEQLQKWTSLLQKYKAGKASVDRRVISSEQWWKLRNEEEEQIHSDVTFRGFRSKSGWLHNVLINKHADMMESYPSPVMLPREPMDKAEAQKLSSIIPFVLEQAEFEQTYSDACWEKVKTGTAVYKITFDAGKNNGLGDISITHCHLLNLYWEPGITDIQQSRAFFHVELVDNDVLENLYPQYKDKRGGNYFQPAKFLYDDSVPTDGKSTVIDVYYKVNRNGRQILHYCKYCGNTVLYASEDDPQYADRGYYDHGLYPYVFDCLFPVEGSPAGYGYVDLCRATQEEIDLLQTAITQNAVVNAKPRYFIRQDGSINEEEFSDMERTLVHVDGNLGEDSLKIIQSPTLSSTYVTYLEYTIQELRETSGNTETATGSISGSTAASAIAALQAASGKGSKDAIKSSWRCFSKIVQMCIELVRQFYDLPRSFRITGQYGEEQFTTYTNAGLQPQQQIGAMGQDMGYRLPVFDIKVSAQTASQYTTVANNELMLQLFGQGFMNPQLSDQVLMCLDGMDFDGKEELQQKIQQYGTIHDKLIQWEQMALSLAQKYDPAVCQQLSQLIMQDGGQPMPQGGGNIDLQKNEDLVDVAGMGVTKGAQTRVNKAAQQAEEAAQPTENRQVAKH